LSRAGIRPRCHTAVNAQRTGAQRTGYVADRET
jgi:hypothetical protein